MAWNFIKNKKESDEDAEYFKLEAERDYLQRQAAKAKKRQELREEIRQHRNAIREDKYGKYLSIGRKIRSKGERIAASKGVGNLFDGGRINPQGRSGGGGRAPQSSFLQGFDYWHPQKKALPVRRKKRREQVIIIRR